MSNKTLWAAYTGPSFINDSTVRQLHHSTIGRFDNSTIPPLDDSKTRQLHYSTNRRFDISTTPPFDETIRTRRFDNCTIVLILWLWVQGQMLQFHSQSQSLIKPRNGGRCYTTASAQNNCRQALYRPTYTTYTFFFFFQAPDSFDMSKSNATFL